MSGSGVTRKVWAKRIVAIAMSALTAMTVLALVPAAASAAPRDKSTTTTTPPPSTTTTTAAPSGGTGGGGVANPKLVAVVALSRHRTLATYDHDLDAAALQASSYAYYSTQNVNLPVLSVSRATNNQAFVLTGAQDPVTYTVKLPKTSHQLSFTGSATVEPKVDKATPLSKTQILITFSDPVGASALDPANYVITVAGSSATLNVESATPFGSDGKQILLTTAPQEPVAYNVTVNNILGTNGAYVDPTATSTGATGSTVAPGPMLLGVNSNGSTQVILTFDSPLDPASANNPVNYKSTPNLFISAAALQSGGRQVVLTTGPQYQLDYSIVANVIGANGNPVNPTMNTGGFKGTGDPVNTERPTVVTAGSTGNTAVVVQFSKPMADSTADPSHFSIVQTVTHPEVGALTVTGAQFVDSARLSVRLTTLSQAEVSYKVTVSNVTDVQGNPLADKTSSGGAVIDPTSFTFAGTPPAYLPCPRPDAPTPCVVIDERVNSDGDSLWDYEETRGWQITIKLANGQTEVRQVTSNPYSADTDNDGIKDNDERALNSDPRDADTDDDGIGDEPEYNVYFSDPANQDTDADGLFDGLETGTFNTSPIFDDTDGDQLKDGYEINVNRNPKVADLPQPLLEVGDTHMGLDVRFTQSNGTSTSQLDAKSVEATLSQSSDEEYSSTESATHEASTKIGYDFGFEVGYEDGPFGKVSFDTSSENTNTNSFTSDFTSSSAASTEKAYTDSLSTEKTSEQDATVTREVDGANLSLAVTLRSAGNVGFTAKNLQIAALIQDPNDPTRLTPIATLIPDSGLDTSFTLGPLVPPKGPIVFSSSTVFPQLIDELMKDPRGLVFRFANYDIVDEAGRNFAFTSQDVNDRTARVAIDYGGFDPDGNGQGQPSEILRVATGIIGRVVDTNGDGKIDTADRKVVFDPSGHQVGITLRDALSAAGLKAYDEDANPTASLSSADKQNSYSTKKIDGTEVLFRVRNRQIKLGSPQSWEVVDSKGIDRSLTLDQRVLYPGTNVTLMFLEDSDHDGLPAVTEAVHGCKDTAADTDSDTLDDRFEVLVGWQVTGPLGTRTVRSRCTSPDSDGDGLSDVQEAPGHVYTDTNGAILFEANASAGAPPRSVADLATTKDSSVVTSATANFSASDVGMLVTGPSGGPIAPTCVRILSVANPTTAALTAPATATATNVAASVGSPYTAPCAPTRNTTATGVDGAIADPVTDPMGRDTDFDGLTDSFELVPYKNAIDLPMRQTSPEHPDSDGDGLTDGVERNLGGDPRLNDAVQFTDSDHDGLTDAQEVGDDNGDFVIDDQERGNAGWDVTVTQMAPRLDSPDQVNKVVAKAIVASASPGEYLVTGVQNLKLGTVVTIKQESSSFQTTVDKIAGVFGTDGFVTFGLPFTLGTSGADISLAVCQNGTCPPQHVTTVQRVYSSKFDADTDDDGLTDFEEHELGTNPGCALQTNASGQPTVDCKPNQATKDLDRDGVRDGWDTDRDGLTDFQEVRGFKLQDGTTVKTKPTYVDTDNDRRTDGEEAGVPGGEFIVRLPAGVAYQAFTNPTKADTDFDQLVDGDEQTFAIDPTKANTDADNQGDYSEVQVGRRPAVPDMVVKMNFVRLEVTKDGEKDGDAGDFQFEFNAVLPNGDHPLVAYSDNHQNGTVPTLQLDKLPGAKPLAADGSGNCPDGNAGGPCWHITKNGTNTVVRIDGGLSVPFTLDGSGRVVDVGSVSTTDAVPEQFGISGFLQEMDGAENDAVACKVNIFPDIFGNPADGTGLVKGSQLRLGVNSMAVHRSGVSCGDGDLDFTLMVSYTAL
jgi:thrombospondin type 3 repeat protein